MRPLHNATELYITAADADIERADDLARALERRARAIVRGRFDAGTDEEVATRQALDEAGLVVVLLSRTSALDPKLRADVEAILARRRTDPSRVVVPVFLDEESEQKPCPVRGLGGFQGIFARRIGGIPGVADAIATSVRGLRSRSQRCASVAVVAVSDELGDVREAVAKRLRGMSVVGDVVEIDAGDRGAAESAHAADFVLLLVGGRTGGADTFATLLAAGADGLKSARIDPDLVPDDEYAAAKVVRTKLKQSFTTVEEVEARALEIFADWLRRWAPREPGRGTLLEPWERAYLVARFAKWEAGSHGGLAALSSGRKLDRARLYVPLRATTDGMHVDPDGRVVLRSNRGPSVERSESSEREHIELMDRERTASLVGPFLEQLVAHPEMPCLVIEGEAGAGKTVLLQHLAYALACRHLGEPPPLSHLDLAALEADAPLLRIPLLLNATQMAEYVPRGEVGELAPALTAELRRATGDTSIDEEAVSEGLRAGRYLLLVDSLDEVPGREGRERVAACLTAMAKLDSLSRCRLVLTTRLMAQTGVPVDKRLSLATVAALDNDAITRLVERRSIAMGEDDVYRADLLDAIRLVAARHPGVGESSLVANPLLLTCTMLVYDQQKLLPDSAAALFERMVKLLCDAKRSPTLSSEMKREALERVFWSIQEKGGTARPAREIADELLGWNRPLLQTMDGALDLLDQLAVETGLLRFETSQDAGRRSQRIARPWHRSFQQFLAACRVGSVAESVAEGMACLFEAEANCPARIDDPAWDGVLCFLLGVHAHRGSDRARAFLYRLIEHSEKEAMGAPRRARVLGLAAQGLAENPDVLPGDSLREDVRRVVAEGFEREGASWPLADRLRALEALGRLGDPRLERSPWVDIAGGYFTMGDGGPYSLDPPRSERLASFRMFSRPVTVQDYSEFIQGGGYRDPVWWKAGRQDGVTEPDEWSAQRFHPNRPVVGVDWYEAMAFCAWASDEWGLQIDLPTDREWEFAARGAEGMIYPWGDEAPGEGDNAPANYAWAGESIGHATPVGAFPRGNRAGLVDLTGNVWEWCRDRYTRDGRPESVRGKDMRGAPRVVRGGSWRNWSWILRCAYRSGGGPTGRGRDLGFRVVCRGPLQA